MHSTKLSLLVICAVVTALWAAPILAQDMPYSYMAGYDPGHSGVSPDALELPLVLSWRHSPEIAEALKAVGSAVVGPDTVYFPAHNTIYAVDRRTGELKWDLSVGHRIYSTPLLHNGVLYFGADDKMIWAVDAESGDRLWQFPTGGAVRCAPLYVSGVLYFGSEDGRIYALDVNSRNLRYAPFQTGGKVRVPPCYYRDTIFAVSQDRHLYAISIRDGGQIWRAELPSEDVFAAPVMERGKVIVASGNKLIAYDARRGVRRWTFTSGRPIFATPATHQRRVYVGSSDGVVYALDSNKGSPIWRFPVKGVRGPISGPLNIAEDTLFVRFGKTNLTALSLADGSVLWEYKLPQPQLREAAKKKDARPGQQRPGDAVDAETGQPIAAGIPDEPGAGMAGRQGRDARGRQAPKAAFEDSVSAGISLGADSAYVVAADGIIYGFATKAADNVKPQITGGLVDVPGRGGILVRFPLVVDRGDTFAGRYADLVEVPGAPPIAVSVSVVDDGTGINPESLTMELDGKLLEITYDAERGLLWYVYDPRGAAVSLRNGVRNFVIAATDWAGNETKAQLAFTVDNSLEPPGPAEKETPTAGEAGPGMPGEIPEPGMPPMP